MSMRRWTGSAHTTIMCAEPTCCARVPQTPSLDGPQAPRIDNPAQLRQCPFVPTYCAKRACKHNGTDKLVKQATYHKQVVDSNPCSRRCSEGCQVSINNYNHMQTYVQTTGVENRSFDDHQHLSKQNVRIYVPTFWATYDTGMTSQQVCA